MNISFDRNHYKIHNIADLYRHMSNNTFHPDLRNRRNVPKSLLILHTDYISLLEL